MTLVRHVKNLVLKGNWWRTLMKGLKLKAKSYTSALSVFENFVSIKRTQPPRIKNLNCLSSLLVSFGCHFCRFLCTKTDFSRSFFCPQSILDSPLLKLDWRQKNYELSQTWTQKYTKKTVKSTSKVHPNYEEWGQKKLEKLKFLLNLYVLFVWTFFFSTNIPEIITYYYGWKQPISDFPLLTLSWFFFSTLPLLILTGSHGPRQYLTLHWKMTP